MLTLALNLTTKRFAEGTRVAWQTLPPVTDQPGEHEQPHAWVNAINVVKQHMKAACVPEACQSLSIHQNTLYVLPEAATRLLHFKKANADIRLTDRTEPDPRLYFAAHHWQDWQDVRRILEGLPVEIKLSQPEPH